MSELCTPDDLRDIYGLLEELDEAEAEDDAYAHRKVERLRIRLITYVRPLLVSLDHALVDLEEYKQHCMEVQAENGRISAELKKAQERCSRLMDRILKLSA